MKTQKKTNRFIACFFLIIFFPTLLPINLLYASNNGPGAGDANSFEPVDATDMVNLVTGDMSYVLPLLNVPSPEGGYPLALSYHAGIAMDQEASWVGLGWSLNPGAINRSVNGYADDTGSGDERFLAYDEGEELNYYTVGIGGNLKGITLGVGASWGSNKAFGGTVALGYNGFTVSGSTSGSIGVGYNSGSIDMGSSDSMGTSLSTKSGVGMSAAGGSSSSSNSYTLNDYNIKESYSGINIDYFINFYYGHTKIKYSLFKEDYSSFQGTLYPLTSNINEQVYPDTNLLTMYSGTMSPIDIKEGDRYSLFDNQILPSSDKYFINAQGFNGTMTPSFIDQFPLRYNDYNIAVLYNTYSTLPQDSYFPELDNTFSLNNKFFYEIENQNTSFLRVNRSNIVRDWNAEDPYLGDPYDYANNIQQHAKTNWSGLYPESLLYNSIYPNGIALKNGNRKRTGKFVESFTNSQINSGTASTGGWFLEAANLNRTNQQTYTSKSIGAFRVTDIDGKVYHYSLPVINYEEWYKNFTNSEDEDEHFVERMRSDAYATDWLLTAITGPDYVDANNNNKIDAADYGYWVEFDYGKWSDGYVWNTASGDYDVLDEGIDDHESYEYYQGRKQIYYLDAVKTRTHTAYFIKSLRKDAMGQELKTYNTPYAGGTFDVTTYCKDFATPHEDWGCCDRGVIRPFYYGLPTEFEGMHANMWYGTKHVFKYFDFPQHYSLKLDKILLVKNNTLNINKAAGVSLTGATKAYMYDNGAFDLTGIANIGGGEAPSTDDYNGMYYVYNNPNVKQIDIHQSQNVLDVNDVAGLNLNQYAERIITFDHDYKLMGNSPNSIANAAEGYHGRLRLNKVDFAGKEGVSVLPGYAFEYNGGNGFSASDEDAWGYSKQEPEQYSLRNITMPTGAKLYFSYEPDDYSAIGAKASRFFDKGLRFHITKNTTTNELQFTLYKNTEGDDNIYPDFAELAKCFTVGQKTGLDMFICRRSKYGGHDREVKLDLSGVLAEVTAVTATSVSFKLPDSPSYWTFNDQDAGWILNRIFSYTSVKFANESNDGVIMRTTEDRECYGWRNSYDNDDVSFQYKLASSNISNIEKGGGIRVKSISVLNPVAGSSTNIVNYYYNKPGYNKVQGATNYKSSGVTSFGPSDDVLIIPYMSELPPPVVMYGNVSVEEVNYQNELLQKSDYVFEVLPPFTESQTNLYSLPNYLDINTIQNEYISDANLGDHSVKFSKHQIKSKISNLGRLVSVKNYNGVNQLLSSHKNTYFVPQDLLGEIGTREESYISKQRNWPNLYTPIYNNRVNSISKVWYPNMLVSTSQVSGGHSQTVYYDKPDFLTGNPLETRVMSSTGKSYKLKTVPAYTKYSGMGAKADQNNNKNMLTQSAAQYSYLLDDATSTWKETGVGITTWNNVWSYKAIDGTITTPTADKEKIWRLHKSYVWNGVVDSNGIFQNYNSATDDGFNWTVGVGSQPSQWRQLSEASLYSHYSSLLEGKDINGNPSAIKMCDNETKVAVTGSAGYSEMFYSGAEYISGIYTDAEVKLVNGSRTTTYAHTGRFSISASSSTQFGTLLKSGQHKAGKYKVSVWVHKTNEAAARLCIGNYSTVIAMTNAATAGDWILKTAVIDVPVGDYYPYLSSTSGTVRYDDLRIHPLSAQLTSYVYNNWDEVSYITGPNNLSTYYEYDAEGRILKTFVEVIDDSANNIIGGFKLVSKNEYHNYLAQ